tara:strand:- start:429 stop:1265 length:837 start_codon:yes stop_codon:yes gene_type:complete
MYPEIFLIVLALIWISFASIQDLRKRIVSNWISFSLIVFALGFRFFYSLFEADGFVFFYQGLIGLGIFFVIGNIFYYGRLFAGGDAKLMIALGTVLPLSNVFLTNVKLFILFFFVFLFVGGFYGVFYSVFLIFSKRNFKQYNNEAKKIFNSLGKLKFFPVIFGIIFILLGFFELIFVYFGILIFILLPLYIYAKVVDEVCLVKNVKTSKLEEGDWITKDLKINSKLIKKSWEGLSKSQIKEIRKKYDSIKIREGIPFIPVFLISFLAFVYFSLIGFNL